MALDANSSCSKHCRGASCQAVANSVYGLPMNSQATGAVAADAAYRVPHHQKALSEPLQLASSRQTATFWSSRTESNLPASLKLQHTSAWAHRHKSPGKPTSLLPPATAPVVQCLEILVTLRRDLERRRLLKVPLVYISPSLGNETQRLREYVRRLQANLAESPGTTHNIMHIESPPAAQTMLHCTMLGSSTTTIDCASM